MYDAHDALVCIGEKYFVDDKNRFRYSNQHYFKSQEELEKLYSDIPEALENNYNFHKDLILNQINQNQFYHLYASKESGSPEEELLKLANKGLENRLENFIFKKNKIKSKEQIKNIYEDRLKHEIDIINSMNYASYFLIVSDYIKWAKNNSIPVGPGKFRGWLISSLLIRYYRFRSN